MIKVQEVPIEEAVKVNALIPEFNQRETYSKEYFEKRYTNRKRLIIMAYLNDQPAGYLVGYDHFNDNSFYCWMAGVVPEFRRKGILTALMNHQEHWAKQQGYTKIKIKTRNCRKEMIFYLIKNNFLFTGVIEHPNIQENRILLEKDIHS